MERISITRDTTATSHLGHRIDAAGSWPPSTEAVAGGEDRGRDYGDRGVAYRASSFAMHRNHSNT